MAKFTLEELYYGDKYNIMGNAAAEMLRRGVCEDEQTQVELCLVKHTLLVSRRAALRMWWTKKTELYRKTPM